MSIPERIELDCGPVAAIDLALYAAASGDHNPLHLDAEVAHAAGFDRPVVHGMLTMAHLGRLITRHFGEQSLMSLATRFVAPAVLGDTIHLNGTLAEVANGVARYDITARNSKGATLATGAARVRLATDRQPAP
jgi:acyl dehydratase